MAGTSLEVRFTLPLSGVSAEHQRKAELAAREAFVMALLGVAEISAGRAAELLGITRGELDALMSRYQISPFANLTQVELERDLANADAAICRRR